MSDRKRSRWSTTEIEAFARHIAAALSRPIKKEGGWWRIGNNGSLAIHAQHGAWFDHESKTKRENSGLMELAMQTFGIASVREALDCVEAAVGRPAWVPDTSGDKPEADSADRLREVLDAWSSATPVDNWFSDGRKSKDHGPIVGLRPWDGGDVWAFEALGPPKRTHGSPKGLAWHCVPHQQGWTHLAVCEGAKTAAAVSKLVDLETAVFALQGTNGLSEFFSPAWVEKLTIYADHDKPNENTGLRPGLEAAKRCAEGNPHVEVTILQPDKEGQDFADKGATPVEVHLPKDEPDSQSTESHDAEYFEWKPTEDDYAALMTLFPEQPLRPVAARIESNWSFLTVGPEDPDADESNRRKYIESQYQLAWLIARHWRRVGVPFRHVENEFKNRRAADGRGAPLSWIAWNDDYGWTPTTKAEMGIPCHRFALKFLRKLVRDKDDGKLVLTEDRRTAGSVPWLGGVVDILGSGSPCSTDRAQLNRHAYLRGLPGCMALDLRTGAPRPQVADDLITKNLAVSPEISFGEQRPDHPIFELIELMAPVAATRRYLYYLIALSVLRGDWTGRLIILDGINRSGKTTLTRAVTRMMGDYGKEGLPTEFLTQGLGKGKQDPWKGGNAAAKMNGMTVASVADVGEHAMLSEERLKIMSGSSVSDERITGSKDNVEVQFEATVWAPTNKTPAPSKMDMSVLNRTDRIEISDKACSYPLKLKQEAESERGQTALLGYILPLCRTLLAKGELPPVPPQIQRWKRDWAMASNPLMQALHAVGKQASGDPLFASQVADQLTSVSGRLHSPRETLRLLRESGIRVSDRRQIFNGIRGNAVIGWSRK